MNSPVLITLIICIVIVIITLLISLCIVYRVKRQHDEKVAEFQRKRNAVAGSNAKDKNNITVSPKSSNSSIAKDELELASTMPDDRNNININDNDGTGLQMTQPGLKVKKSTDGKAAYQSVGL